MIPSHCDSGCPKLNSSPYGPGNHELHNKDVLPTFLSQLPCGQYQIILHAQGQSRAFSDSGTSTQHLHEPTLSLEIISAPSMCLSTSWAAQKSEATRENFGLNIGKWRHNQDHLLLRLAVQEKRPCLKGGSQWFFILCCSVEWNSSNDAITTCKCPSQARTHLAPTFLQEKTPDTGLMMLISVMSFT